MCWTLLSKVCVFMVVVTCLRQLKHRHSWNQLITAIIPSHSSAWGGKESIVLLSFLKNANAIKYQLRSIGSNDIILKGLCSSWTSPLLLLLCGEKYMGKDVVCLKPITEKKTYFSRTFLQVSSFAQQTMIWRMWLQNLFSFTPGHSRG